MPSMTPRPALWGLLLIAGCSNKPPAACEEGTALKDGVCISTVVADKTQPSDAGAVDHFLCDKIPSGPPGLRMCNSSNGQCSKPDRCFARATAYCYIRSLLELAPDKTDQWSRTEVVASCFVTSDECERDQSSVGMSSPPPTLTKCVLMRADEVPKLKRG